MRKPSHGIPRCDYFASRMGGGWEPVVAEVAEELKSATRPKPET